MLNVFAYGTLMFPEVIAHLIGDLGPGDLGPGEPAAIADYARFEATTRSWANYPYVVPRAGETVNGLLFQNISPAVLARLDWFENEGDLYHRRQVDRIQIGGKQVEMDVWLYVIGPGLQAKIEAYALSQSVTPSEIPWEAGEFEKNELKTYLEKAVIPAVKSLRV